MIRRGDLVDRTRIRYAVALAREGDVERNRRDSCRLRRRRDPPRQADIKLHARWGSSEYVEAIRETMTSRSPSARRVRARRILAMALAVVALKNKEVERIVLTRPAVEAGEKLGFLPGDLTQKVDPYLRPLYDALYDLMGVDSYQKLVERGVVEVAPLAYMRGRTLSDSFIILDEAQNTDVEQMKMFLTRLGFHTQSRRDRRHDPDGLALREEIRLGGGNRNFEGHSGNRHGAPDAQGRRPPRAGADDCQGV